MALTEAFADTGTTIGTSEYSLPNDSTSLTARTEDGCFQAFIDFANMAAGDQYRVRIYEKVYSAGTQRVIYECILTGTQQGPLVAPSLILMHGWDVTVKKLAGTDRSISWSIRQVA